jgi:ligand-binding sensor protein
MTDLVEASDVEEFAAAALLDAVDVDDDDVERGHLVRVIGQSDLHQLRDQGMSRCKETSRGGG